jgi:hypothetical protein
METNYKAKIQIQIVMDKLKLNPEQLQILEEELLPLYKDIDEEEKCSWCSDYDNGFIDGHQ